MTGSCRARLGLARASIPQTINFYPGTQPTGQPGPSGSGFFVFAMGSVNEGTCTDLHRSHGLCATICIFSRYIFEDVPISA